MRRSHELIANGNNNHVMNVVYDCDANLPHCEISCNWVVQEDSVDYF